MIDRQLLLADLKKQVKLLETDLREQVTAAPKVFERLDAEYKRAFKLGRTAATWATWRDDRITQAAAAWVLGTVFVRFCEDNGLLEKAYLAGPTVERMTHAEEAQEDFFRLNPAETDRGWILAAFDAIGSTQAGQLLFDERHNAAYQIPVSADLAKALIAFWRRRGDDGVLIHDFTDPEWDTRFLGDLYQDLSDSARKTYALLQTPEFVEEFILDLTLTPAIEEFGYDVVKMIDPTCGSGHFLLGAFHRLLKEWDRAGKEPHERVRLALDAVHGVDINPFAVAVARFRLVIAALQAGQFGTFSSTSGYHFPIHVAIGDALLKYRQDALPYGEDLADFRYATEDLDDHPRILEPGRYHVTVGNPPYITVKDKGLNEAYRGMYSACYMQYALSVPFAQRLFELARHPTSDGRGAGHVGQITANSFMKREFGRRLVQEFFSSTVDVTYIVDSSGAHIPGHGTPTVILIGKNQKPARTAAVRAVLGIRGEPGAPAVPSKGVVWRAIVDQIHTAPSESAWVTSIDLPKKELFSFPLSLAGGGASQLTNAIEGSGFQSVGQLTRSIGRVTHTGSDDSYFAPIGTWRRLGVADASRVALVEGDTVRDWRVQPEVESLFPYDAKLAASLHDRSVSHTLWFTKSLLSLRREPGGTHEEIGLTWYEWSRFHPERYGVPLGIAMAFVATHNHFVLDRGGKVFNRSAPVIKLPEGAREDDHLRLLGVLNSSTACFWLKQVSHDKGGQSGTGGFTTDEWERFYEFTGTKLQEFPLPTSYPTELATQLDTLARRLTAVSPSALAADSVPTRARLAEAESEWSSTRAKMIGLQEELDWQVYSLYGLLDDLRAPGDSVPELRLGERAFEILLARRVAAGEAETLWFARHGATPITELPKHWSHDYRATVERRIAVIESNRSIGLIERPECKRRWHLAVGNRSWAWADQEAAALRGWLLDRCEARELWFHSVDGIRQPRPLTANQLADELRRDADVLSVAELYAPGKDFAKVIAELVADEHVPYLAALRYKDSGLEKRADWEAVWDLQRAEDAAQDEPARKKIRKSIPVPPKYGSGDFLKPSYWRNRGKLDVPKERFISYPLASPDGDASLLLGWAGWDHREQAQALATLIVDREQTGAWSADRLTPLLGGLREVLPWVRQWHGDFDPLYGGSPAEVYEAFLSEIAGRRQLTDEALTSWRPVKTTRGRKAAGAA